MSIKAEFIDQSINDDINDVSQIIVNEPTCHPVVRRFTSTYTLPVGNVTRHIAFNFFWQQLADFRLNAIFSFKNAQTTNEV
jgi:hypothetical protein